MSEFDSAWLPALGRMWLLLPPRAAPRRGAVAASLIVALICLVAWIAIDRWESQPDPQFFADGIPLLAWYGLAIVGLAAILQWSCRADFASMLIASLGLVPVLMALFTFGAFYLPGLWFFSAAAAVTVYVFLYLGRALRSVTGKPQGRAAFAALLFIAAFVWTTDALNVIPDLWRPAETEASAQSDASDDGEAILFSQAAEIDQALDNIKPDSNAAARAFFVGFAGVGDQKVFAQEIDLASAVIGDKYAVGNRSLSLINDERDLNRGPLATVSGLTYALRGLASRMNLDRDVLFLSVSSHGSEDPVIAVSNSQLPLKDLSEADLAETLRASGIKWRVIIISACYAGAFIDSLRDPQTIVIAAAAADRTSFGCSNDSDLTYFGEAFYRDALPAARTLREAFDNAKAAIALRERTEGVTASNPQAYFGQAAEQKLMNLRRK
jgi:Peptidase C13 family